MNITDNKNDAVRPEVLTLDDILDMVPKLRGHEKLVKRAMHFFKIDEVNEVHSRWCKTPGPEFAKHLIMDDFRVDPIVDNEQELDHLPDGPFITVSNHPFGSIDGIALIYLITRRRPKFKVMVNLMLGKITAMRPNFISVNSWASNDPKMKAVSVAGIREALRQLKQGEPLGFFPAGAMSKINWKGELVDRPWQESVLQIIQHAKVPVIPIYFHGNNSAWFNFLGHACWPLRSLWLPRELFRKRGKRMHISIGNVISPEAQAEFPTWKKLGEFLREQTYSLRNHPVNPVSPKR